LATLTTAVAGQRDSADARHCVAEHVHKRRALYANREHRCGHHPRLTELNPASEHGLRLSQFAISTSHCRKFLAAFLP
jgi:hypothetical protein